MKHFDQEPGLDDLARNVMIVLIALVGITAATVAGVCFYFMNQAGLWAYGAFLGFAALAVVCAGGIIIFQREKKGLH